MNVTEFSNEFDVLLNSNAIIKPFGSTQGILELDEYEKSVLLTEAQGQIVREIYTGASGESFEMTEGMRRSLDSLVNTDELYSTGGTSEVAIADIFTLPENIWFITYEQVKLKEGVYCKNNTAMDVIPIRQDEWAKTRNNPFRGPSKRKAVRLDRGNNKVEIICKYPIASYIIRYLRKPSPIILVDLEDLTIDGLNTKSECELNPVLHRVILERAVQLALLRNRQASK